MCVFASGDCAWNKGDISRWKIFRSNHIIEQGDKMITHYYAAGYGEKGNTGNGFNYATRRMNIGAYIFIFPYLELFSTL